MRGCVYWRHILVYSTTWADHLSHLRAVFSQLDQHKFKVKLSKCSFAQTSLHYLGHVISKDGVSTDPSKVAVIQSWPTPRSVKDIRSFFLGGVSRLLQEICAQLWYSISVPYFFTQKGPSFHVAWRSGIGFPSSQNGFGHSTCFGLAKFFEAFWSWNWRQWQRYRHRSTIRWSPYCFHQWSSGSRHQGLSTYKKECLAILLAVDQWHSYLISGEFIIRTDQHSLIHLDDQRLTTLWQQKALTKLLGLQFCCYKKGSTNRVADALSRLPTEQVMALSVLQPLWFQEVSDSYSRYPDTTPSIQALALKPPSGYYSIHDGIIKYKNHILLPKASAFPEKIFNTLHTTPVGVIQVFWWLTRKYKKLFVWSGMKKMIQLWCSQCTISVNRQNLKESCIQAFLFQYLRVHGKLSQWTSLRVYLPPITTTAF